MHVVTARVAGAVLRCPRDRCLLGEGQRVQFGPDGYGRAAGSADADKAARGDGGGARFTQRGRDPARGPDFVAAKLRAGVQLAAQGDRGRHLLAHRL